MSLMIEIPKPPLDATRILPKLYQGSAPPQGRHLFDRGFSTLVLCAFEIQPAAGSFPGIEVVRCPIHDINPIDRETWREAAVAAAIVSGRLVHGKRVLVTCAAGRNRSGLVTAMTMHMATGMTGKQAVQLIQSKRANALTNTAFANALCTLGAK